LLHGIHRICQSEACVGGITAVAIVTTAATMTGSIANLGGGACASEGTSEMDKIKDVVK